MPRRVWAQIDASALRHNLAVVRGAAPNTQVMAVLKADAYGHGQAFIAQTLAAQVDAIAVATLEEGLMLREQGCRLQIVCLSGLIAAEQLAACQQHAITPTFYDSEQLKWLASFSQSNAPLKDCWVKVNTGMNRLGFNLDEIQAAVATCRQFCRGKVRLMSHFASADQPANPKSERQLAKFKQAVKSIPNCEFSLAHSAAILTIAQSHFDWVRPGIMLYGGSPLADKTAKDLGLQAVMHFKSTLISIYTVPAGQSVGYAGNWTAARETRIGIVSAGYADGYPRNVSSQAYVLVNGDKAPIIGRISMDTLAIDLSQVQVCEHGDEVELWGAALSVDTVASWAGTIGYELLSRVGQRVPRVNIDRLNIDRAKVDRMRVN